MLRSHKVTAALISGVAISLIGGAASAQEFTPKQAGQLLVRLRGIAVAPVENGTWKLPSGAEIAGSGTTLGSSQVPEADFSYFITDNIAVELIAGVTRHDVKVNVSGTQIANAGHVWLLPPTATVQYHPFPAAQFSPYIGAGINYTFFFNAGGWDSSSGVPLTKVKYSDNVGGAFQVGFDYALSGPWSLNLDVKKLILSTTARATSPGIGVLKSDVEINPWIVGIGAGYRF
ncbi:MAG: OmpW family outer membrane protein [Azospirillaceae bacterium]|nr:OmpW family outer membrane protein [Azospirillaceae bacterium]